MIKAVLPLTLKDFFRAGKYAVAPSTTCRTTKQNIILIPMRASRLESIPLTGCSELPSDRTGQETQKVCPPLMSPALKASTAQVLALFLSLRGAPRSCLSAAQGTWCAVNRGRAAGEME